MGRTPAVAVVRGFGCVRRRFGCERGAGVEGQFEVDGNGGLTQSEFTNALLLTLNLLVQNDVATEVYAALRCGDPSVSSPLNALDKSQYVNITILLRKGITNRGK